MINTLDQLTCTGCGTCSKSCGLDVFRLDTNQPELSPCMAACPAGTDIRGYHARLQLGDVEGALALLLTSNPFPAVTGRVCFHPCETQCARRHVDIAVSINAVEQFLGDVSARRLPTRAERRHLAKVAVVGAGPAGLAAAWFLGNMGYPVTVFEAESEAGGMLRYAIPAYRLPTEVVRNQTSRLRALGVDFCFNTRIGAGQDLGLLELRQRGFRSVILATGTGLSRKIPVPGADKPGMFWGLEFLRATRLGEAPSLSGHVAVIGGGDVAVDAAICAKKLGADRVTMISLESEGALPAYPHNLEDAEREGVAFMPGWGPLRVEGEGTAYELVVRPCVRVLDDNGAFNPLFGEGERRVAVSHVIFAVGQRAEPNLFDQDVDCLPGGLVKTHALTGATSCQAVFAAGDLATGPASVVRAIAGGREAAISVDRYLRGMILTGERAFPKPLVPEDRLPGKDIAPLPRNDRRTGTAGGFAELRQGLPLDEAFAESLRCMTCGSKAVVSYRDDCMTCYTCELVCPVGAIDVHPFKETLPRTL